MKAIAFRPSDKASEKIKATMQEQKINRTKAINVLIEREQPIQLEQALPKRKDVTGKLIQCPLRPYPIKYPLGSTVYFHLPVDSSVCKSCPKYPCEAWENIESHKRLGLATGLKRA